MKIKSYNFDENNYLIENFVLSPKNAKKYVPDNQKIKPPIRPSINPSDNLMPNTSAFNTPNRGINPGSVKVDILNQKKPEIKPEINKK